MKENISENDYLGGRIRIRQPLEGYRAGLDAVMVSAALHPKPSSKILDVGCGVGTIMLCASFRHPQCSYIGLEIQEDLSSLAQHNILLNHRESTCSVVTGDVRTLPPSLKSQTFDYVVSNPPYFKEATATSSPYISKNKAHIEDASLEEWLKLCLKFLKPRGIFTMIYPLERLSEVLQWLHPKIGEIKLYPLWPKVETPAKRFILQGRKDLKTGLTLFPGMVLHGENGRYTSSAKEILEKGKGLIF